MINHSHGIMSISNGVIMMRWIVAVLYYARIKVLKSVVTDIRDKSRAKHRSYIDHKLNAVILFKNSF